MATKTRNVQSAKAGESVTTPFGDEVTVLASCGESDGHWVCSTHREAFGNNLQASIHEYAGRHTTFWMCFKHGPEAP